MDIRLGSKKRSAHGKIEELSVDAINENPYQNRTIMDEPGLLELAESIRVHGILQPVLVRKSEGRYFLISGERRIRAARLAGFDRIPALVKEMSDVEAAAATLVENLQREDVSFLDEAAGFLKLNTEFGVTQIEIARLVGKSQSYVANKVRLLNLPISIREIISREIMITERHCRALLRLPDEATQMTVLHEIIRKKLNTEQTDLRVEKIVNDSSGQPKQNRKMVVKDIRIFLNSINIAIDALRSTGIETEWIQTEEEDYYDYRIRIKK